MYVFFYCSDSVENSLLSFCVVVSSFWDWFFVLYFLLNTWNWNLILHVTTVVLCLISRCSFHVKAFSVGRGGYRTGGYRNDAYWSCCGNHVSKGHICPIKVNKISLYKFVTTEINDIACEFNYCGYGDYEYAWSTGHLVEAMCL